MRKRTIGPAAALVAAFVLAPVSGKAGIRVIAPEHLQPVTRESEAFEISTWRATSDDATEAYFQAPVNLPRGVRIRKMTLYSWGSVSSTRRVYLYRVRTGEPAERLMAATTQEDRSQLGEAPVATVATPLPAVPSGAFRVRRGYRYYVQLYVSSYNGQIQGVTVNYR